SPRPNPAPRAASACCRNGTSPTSMAGSMIRRSNATSTAPTPKAWRSRRPTKASSRRSWGDPRRGSRRAPAGWGPAGAVELLGRLTSYAGLLHAGDTVDPARAKFYADVQERVTAASTHLLFFTLELNRLDDAKLDAAMQDRALAHYRPWIEDVRKDKPYQL